ncbi:MAG: aminotransferase class I/II-fold pyridoxal phosphate-dependent enzyme [Clostridia bacterium]|nr:aminotransferase class I/II-fold pyridoxal phosphate-dependent enzyme [Clostridia bacterium]
MKNKSMSVSELESQLEAENKSLLKLKKEGISVDMSRGRPAKNQLDLAMPMLENAGKYNYILESGDARNYGPLGGIPQMKKIFAEMLDVNEKNVMVGDGSSLSIMYTLFHFAEQFGILGMTPWNKLEKVKFICPAPGYDRHFAICEQFGIEMITVPMLSDGPDMNIVEELVKDEAVKGIWCVPKYSNPTGVIFSDKVVERMAALKPAAKDFRVFWDNAYCVHSLYDTNDKLKNIFDLLKKHGNENMVYEFASTSKITFGGSGVSCLATSEENLQDILKKMFFMEICPNKVNQVMHAEYMKDLSNVRKIMAKQAEILRPKFELFERKLSEAFTGDEDVKWTTPKGGYFITVEVKGCAKRIVEIAKETGVKFTPAGAPYPYKHDDQDAVLRIAPSVPTLEEIDFASDVLVEAIKIAKIEKQLSK